MSLKRHWAGYSPCYTRGTASCFIAKVAKQTIRYSITDIIWPPVLVLSRRDGDGEATHMPSTVNLSGHLRCSCLSSHTAYIPRTRHLQTWMRTGPRRRLNRRCELRRAHCRSSFRKEIPEPPEWHSITVAAPRRRQILRRCASRQSTEASNLVVLDSYTRRAAEVMVSRG
jgi:hypothetical protein